MFTIGYFCLLLDIIVYYWISGYFCLLLGMFTIGLLAIYLEKSLRWRLQASLFFDFTEKNISLFGEELLLEQLSIQLIDQFLEVL